MLHVHRLDSLDAPELAPYRTLRQHQEHRDRGIFVAEGEKVVRRLLESPLEVLSLLLPEKWFRQYEPILARRSAETIHVYLAEKKVLEELTGFSMFQGVLAVGRVPSPPTLDDLVATSAAPRLFVAVDGLANAENLGALVRNAVAFGAQGLLADRTSSSPYLRRAVRSSMGTVLGLPVIERLELPAALDGLRRRGFHTVAAHPHTDRRRLSEADFTGDTCVVFGSEGHGLSAAVLAGCDEAVAIPMAAGVDSLNVGSAAAAFLYEANRQRRRA